VSAQDVQGLVPRGPVSSIRQGDLPDGTTPDQRDILGLHHRNAPNFFPGWTAWGTRSTVCSVRRGYSVRKLLASSSKCFSQRRICTRSFPRARATALTFPRCSSNSATSFSRRGCL